MLTNQIQNVFFLFDLIYTIFSDISFAMAVGTLGGTLGGPLAGFADR